MPQPPPPQPMHLWDISPVTLQPRVLDNAAAAPHPVAALLPLDLHDELPPPPQVPQQRAPASARPQQQQHLQQQGHHQRSTALQAMMPLPAVAASGLPIPLEDPSLSNMDIDGRRRARSCSPASVVAEKRRMPAGAASATRPHFQLTSLPAPNARSHRDTSGLGASPNDPSTSAAGCLSPSTATLAAAAAPFTVTGPAAFAPAMQLPTSSTPPSLPQLPLGGLTDPLPGSRAASTPAGDAASLPPPPVAHAPSDANLTLVLHTYLAEAQSVCPDLHDDSASCMAFVSALHGRHPAWWQPSGYRDIPDRISSLPRQVRDATIAALRERQAQLAPSTRYDSRSPPTADRRASRPSPQPRQSQQRHQAAGASSGRPARA
jgi:hypothetical protein